MANVEIGFNIPIDPNFHELAQLMGKLISETNELQKSMIDLPIDELARKHQNYSTQIGNLSIEYSKLNPSQKESQNLMLQMVSVLEATKGKIDNVIEVQKLWRAEGEKQQNMLSAISKETSSAAEKNLKLVEAYGQLQSKIQFGEKLNSTQEKQLISIQERIEANIKVIQDNANVLALYNSRVKENSVELERNLGYIEKLEEQISELIELRRSLSKEELNSVEMGAALDSDLSALTATLSGLKSKVDGRLESERALNAVIEQNIILSNKTEALALVDIDVKAKQIIETDKLNQAIQNQVSIIRTGMTLKEVEQQKSIEKQGELEEKELAKFVEIKNKEVIAEQESQIKIQMAQQKAIDRQGEKERQALLRYTEIENKKAAASEAAAGKSVWTWEHFVDVFERSGVRMLASTVWYSALTGVVFAIAELWTRVAEKEQIALDRVKDYFESIKQIDKIKRDSVGEIAGGASFNSFEAHTQESIMGDKINYNLEQRHRAYLKLKSIAPAILDDMDKQNYALREGDERMQSQLKNLNLYIGLQEKISKGKQVAESMSKADAENDVEREALIDKIFEKRQAEIKKYGGDPNYYSRENIKKSGETSGTTERSSTHNDYENDLADLRKLNLEKRNRAGDLKKELDSLRESEKELAALEGNMKDPKAKKVRTMQEMLEDETENHRLKRLANQKQYDESNQSFNEKVALHEREYKEEIRHKAKMLQIIKDYGDKSGEDEIKLSKRRKSALSEKEGHDKEAREKAIAEVEQLREYEAEKERVIEESQRKLEQFTRDTQKRLEEFASNKKRGDIQHDTDSGVDLLGAALGTGGNRPIHEYQNELKQKQITIDQNRRNLQDSASAGAKAESNLLVARSKVSNLDLIPDSLKSDDQKAQSLSDDKKKSPSQLKIDKENIANYQKALDEKAKADSKFAEDKIKLDESIADKTQKITLHDKEGKVAIAKATLDATERMANSQFDLQKKRIQQQMQGIQSLAQFEMTLAGNNSAAKIRIAQQEHGKLVALKRKEGQIEKEQAIFNETISMFQGIAAAWKIANPVLSPILAGIVAAAGLKSIADTSSAPLPSYRSGRKGGRKESALINEDGFELVESGGKYKVFGGGSETIANLEAGDIVHTHKDSISMIGDNNKFLQSLIRGSSIMLKRDNIERSDRIGAITQSLSKSDIQEAMTNAVKTIPKQEIILPADFVVKSYFAQINRMQL